MKFRALSDNIVCVNADFGEQVSAGGILITDNLNKSQGITSRWFQVFAVGPKIDWVRPSQWILVEYGRWTPKFFLSDDSLSESPVAAWKVDPKGCLAVSDQKPQTLYYNSETVASDRRTR
jgi:hypothetical protein